MERNGQSSVFNNSNPPEGHSNDLPEDFELLNTDDSVTHQDREHPNETERLVIVTNENTVANEIDSSGHEEVIDVYRWRSKISFLPPRSMSLRRTEVVSIRLMVSIQTSPFCNTNSHHSDTAATKCCITTVFGHTDMPINRSIKMLTLLSGKVTPFCAPLDSFSDHRLERVVIHARQTSFAETERLVLQTLNNVAIRIRIMEHNVGLLQDTPSANPIQGYVPMQESLLASAPALSVSSERPKILKAQLA